MVNRNRFLRYFLISFIAVLAFSNSACTRKKDPSYKLVIPVPKNITLAQGKVGTLANTQIVHMLANVHASSTGGGVLATFNWDSHHYDPVLHQEVRLSAPPSIEFDVPSGSGRLVQLLVVLADPQNENAGYVFGYADAVVDIVGAQASVTLSPVALGATSSREGMIAGRYVTATNAGPTGKVDIFIQPVSTRPKMLLESSYMYGGYFSAFYVDGAHFQYYMPQLGLPLFGNTDFSSTNLSYNTSRALFHTPSSYRAEDFGGGTCNVRFKESEDHIIGYFTPAGQESLVASNNVFIDPTSTPVPGVYSSSGTDCASLSGSVMFSPFSTSDLSYHVISGGNINTTSNTNEFSEFLRISADMFSSSNDQGKESFLGFKGPYQYYTVNGKRDFVHYTFSGSGLELNWKYLPGVFNSPDSINGSRIYFQTGVPDMGMLEMYRMSNGDAMDCNRLQQAGFSFIDAPGTAQSITLSGVTSSSQVVAVICPYKYYDMSLNAGYKLYIHSGSCPTCGGGASGPRFEIRNLSGGIPEDSVADETCVDLRIYAIDSSGNTITAPAGGIPFNLNANTNGINLSNGTATACGSITTHPGNGFNLSIPSGQNFYEFRAKGWAPGWWSLWASGSGYSQAWHELAVYMSPATPTESSIDVVQSMAYNMCYPVRFKMKGTMEPMVSSTATTITFGGGSMATFNYFSDSSCSTALASNQFILPAYQNSSFVYMKPTGSSYSNSEMLNMSWSGGSGSISGIAIDTATQTQWYGHGMSLNQNFYEPGQCFEYRVYAANSVLAPVPAPVASSIATSITGGVFYSDMNCTTSVGSSTNLSIASGALGSEHVYVMSSSNSLDINMSANALTGVLTGFASAPYTAAFTAQHSGTLASSTCSSPYTVEFRKSNGDPYVVPSGMNLTMTVSLSGVTGTFYSDANCTTSLGSPVPINSGSSSYTFYLMHSGGSPSTPINVSITTAPAFTNTAISSSATVP